MSNTKIWALSIIGLACCWVIVVSAPSLMPVVWSVFLAFFIHPIVLQIQSRLKLKQKTIAVAIAVVLILILLVVLLNNILPRFVGQIMVFAREFTAYSQRFTRAMDGLWLYLDGLGLDSRIISQIDDALSQFFILLGNFIRSIVSLLFGYIFRLTDIVIITILLFYFLTDGPDMVLYLIASLPESLRGSARNFVDGINGIVWGYMKNQVIISVITGLASFVTFYVLGLPFSGLLGIICGFLNMIPYFGSILGGVMASVIALIYFSWNKALIVAVVVLGINMVLGNIVTPMLQGRTLGIHPVVVIIALLVCNHIWGAAGMLFAVPLVGLGRLFLREAMNVINRL